MKRLPLLALATVAIVIIVAAEEQVARPRWMAQIRFALANASAGTDRPLAMLWSIETYSDVLQLEGPRGELAPSAVRILDPAGRQVAIGETRILDPAVNIGVCPGHRPPYGTTWWSGVIPDVAAREMRGLGMTSHRVQARTGESWRDVTLIDSGCRGIGRG